MLDADWCSCYLKLLLMNQSSIKSYKARVHDDSLINITRSNYYSNIYPSSTVIKQVSKCLSHGLSSQQKGLILVVVDVDITREYHAPILYVYLIVEKLSL